MKTDTATTLDSMVTLTVPDTDSSATTLGGADRIAAIHSLIDPVAELFRIADFEVYTNPTTGTRRMSFYWATPEDPYNQRFGAIENIPEDRSLADLAREALTVIAGWQAEHRRLTQVLREGLSTEDVERLIDEPPLDLDRFDLLAREDVAWEAGYQAGLAAAQAQTAREAIEDTARAGDHITLSDGATLALIFPGVKVLPV